MISAWRRPVRGQSVEFSSRVCSRSWFDVISHRVANQATFQSLSSPRLGHHLPSRVDWMLPPSRALFTLATMFPSGSLITSENVSRLRPGSPWSVATASNT